MKIQEIALSSALPHAYLVRVRFSGGEVGYSELCSWPQLGNPPLKEEVKKLTEGNPLPSGKRAIEIASIDALARFEGRSLFDDIDVPLSHALVQQLDNEEPFMEAEEEGFTHVKVKLSTDFEQRLPILKRGLDQTQLKLRLDFNASLNSKEWARFLATDLDWSRIEMVEDPTAVSQEWTQGQVAVAKDFVQADPEHYQYEVIKPGRDSLPMDLRKPVVVTSLLATPLGDVIASYFGGILFKSFSSLVLPSGLMCYRRLKNDPFSARLAKRGPTFQTPGGTGFGFDDLLGEQTWNTIL